MNNTMPFLTQAIIHYLFVGSVTATVLVPATWGAIKALRIRAPVYRQLLWLYCLIGIAVVPVIWLYAPKLTLAVLPARVRPASTSPSPTFKASVAGEPDTARDGPDEGGGLTSWSRVNVTSVPAAVITVAARTAGSAGSYEVTVMPLPLRHSFSW